jgi:hypothetical protein
MKLAQTCSLAYVVVPVFAHRLPLSRRILTYLPFILLLLPVGRLSNDMREPRHVRRVRPSISYTRSRARRIRPRPRTAPCRRLQCLPHKRPVAICEGCKGWKRAREELSKRWRADTKQAAPVNRQ